MKSLLLVLSISISIFNFAQVLEISYSKTEMFYNQGEYNESNLLCPLSYESVHSSSPNNATKVLDLNKKIAFIYENGILITELKIKDFKLTEGTYIITLDDISLIDGSPLNTYQVIDTNNKLSYYCWSYKDLKENWLISEKIYDLDIK